jgi:hypothetical protein
MLSRVLKSPMIGLHHRDSAAWAEETARLIRALFEGSSSLRRHLTSVATVYRDAVRLTVIETGLSEKTFPHERPFRVAEILDHDFLPR